MPVCDTSTLNLNTRYPAGVQCTGLCQKFCQSKCADFTQDITNSQKPGIYWICPEYRKTSDDKYRQSLVINDSDDRTEQLSPLSSMTLGVLEDIQGNLAMLNKKYEELLDSVKFCSSKNIRLRSSCN